MVPNCWAIADDELQYTWLDAGVRVTFTRLRETDTGMVRGACTLESVRPRQEKELWWQWVSLSTATDRKTLVGKLDGFAARPKGEWELEVDQLFSDAARRFTKPPQPVDLADVEVTSLDTAFQFAPVLPEGQVTLFLADQGSTKSYLMQYLGCCTVLGHPSVFGLPRRKGPVLFFDWEVDEQVAARRLAWITRGLGAETPHGLHYVNMGVRGRLFDRIRDMRQYVGRIRPVLVIIDSLTFATGGDLNSAEYAAPTMSAIGSLGDGVTKLVSAHPSKAARRAGADDDVSAIGSGLFEFRARAIWLMRREHQGGSSFMVSMQSRKPFDAQPQGPLAYRMRFDNPGRRAFFEQAQVEQSAELSATSLPLVDRIRMLLGQRGAADTKQLADELGATDEAVRQACHRANDIVGSGGGGRGKPAVWTLRSASNGTTEVPWWSDAQDDDEDA